MSLYCTLEAARANPRSRTASPPFDSLGGAKRAGQSHGRSFNSFVPPRQTASCHHGGGDGPRKRSRSVVEHCTCPTGERGSQPEKALTSTLFCFNCIPRTAVRAAPKAPSLIASRSRESDRSRAAYTCRVVGVEVSQLQSEMPSPTVALVAPFKPIDQLQRVLRGAPSAHYTV